MQTIDLRNTKATGPIKQEGIYNTTITDVTEGTSKTSGALQHTIIFTDDETGLSATMWMTWSEKMMGRNKADLMLIGLDLDNQMFDPMQLIGKRVQIECKYGIETQRDALGTETQVKGDFLRTNVIGAIAGAVTPTAIASAQVTPMAPPVGQIQPQAPTMMEQPQAMAPVEQSIASEAVAPQVPVMAPQPVQAPAPAPAPMQMTGEVPAMSAMPPVQPAVNLNVPGLHV